MYIYAGPPPAAVCCHKYVCCSSFQTLNSFRSSAASAAISSLVLTVRSLSRSSFSLSLPWTHTKQPQERQSRQVASSQHKQEPGVRWQHRSAPTAFFVYFVDHSLQRLSKQHSLLKCTALPGPISAVTYLTSQHNTQHHDQPSLTAYMLLLAIHAPNQSYFLAQSG
jgi:hypothetical protein